MKQLKKIEIDGEAVYVKRGAFGKGWRVVHPYKNEDGTTNWFNALTGGWENLIMVSIMVITFSVVIFFMNLQFQEFIGVIDAAKELCPWAFERNITLSPLLDNLRQVPPNITIVN